MKIKEIIKSLESLAPRSYQESYDNSGLIVGDADAEVKGCIICLDSTEEVVAEALESGANLIIAHHPIVFKGLKTFTGKNYVERTVMSAIKHDIAIHACHTNLDNVSLGVNKKICDRLGLRNTSILSPKSGFLNKLVFFCPPENFEQVTSALFEAGAGEIGNYSECGFSSEGKGTFKPGEKANPYEGAIGNRSEVNELRAEVLVENRMLPVVLERLKAVHPYEEVAHDIYPIKNRVQDVGSGMIGELEKEQTIEEFLSHVKSSLNVGCIKYTDYPTAVKKVAVCGGSGGFLLNAAKQKGADVFITSDYKYHEYFDAENDISIFDVGHYESEQFTMELIKDYLINKFPKFAPRLTGVNTNPVKYY